ncbi:glycosyltransferase [Mesorhizobium australicum]|uniref:Glycosyltransferase n=1 Tax=Mesorhizobium australicum TaxID=536018 RepID=A0ACC6SZL9_9HYPH
MNSDAFPEFDAHIFFDELDLPDRRAFSFRYDVMELNTAIKPTIFRRLFAEGFDRVIYLDPDILAYRRFDEILEAFDEGATSVLTPHALAPNLHSESPNDLTFMQAGIYNLGFLALAKTDETSALLEWWETRLRTQCVANRLSDGIFVDQKFMDLWPAYCSGTHILRDPAYNVAYWNLDTRTIKKTSESYEVNGSPLAFFHFSGIIPGDHSVLSKHQQRWKPTSTKELEKLLADYHDQLGAYGASRFSAMPYGFGTFSDGTHIPNLARIVYREKLEPFEGDPFILMPDNLDRPADIKPNPGGVVTQFAHALWSTRRDLQSYFPLQEGRSQINYADWYISGGAMTAGIPFRFTKTVAKRISQIDTSRIGPHGTPDVPAKDASMIVTRVARRAYRTLVRAQPHIRWLYRMVPRTRRKQFLDAMFRRAWPANFDSTTQTLLAPGVSLIGYPFSETGVGEAMRTLARSIESAGINYDVTNFDEQVLSSHRDTALTHRVAARPSKMVNVFCVNADMLGSTIQGVGFGILQNRYNIVRPFWELPLIHPQWLTSLRDVDEIWAPTTFVRDAFTTGTDRPVVHIPVAISIPPKIEANRERFQIPKKSTAFLFAFDFSSYPDRKNPDAVLQAYLRAFGQDRDRRVSLIIKTMGKSPHKRAILNSIRALAQTDKRVVLIDEVLTRAETHCLTKSCDVFISLHRSEGFGLGIAEAMAMGKAVIATDFSGSKDFVSTQTGFPIPYRLISVEPDQYPYFIEGQKWADPDIDEGARVMAQLADNVEAITTVGERARAYMGAVHSPEAVGKVIVNRLQDIQGYRNSILKT